MSAVQEVTAIVADHFDRRWLLWVVGAVALVIGIAIGYALSGGGFGFGASASITGVTAVEPPRQGGW